MASGISVMGVLLILLNAGRTVEDGFRIWPQAIETRVKYQSVLLDITRHWAAQTEASALVVADSFFEPIDADSLRRDFGAPLPARWIQAGEAVGGALVWPAEATLMYVPEYAPLAPKLAAIAGISGTPRYRSQSVPGFAVYDMPAAPQPAETTLVTFEESISLTGYTLAADDEGKFSLYTFWRVDDAHLPADLAIFAHLVAEDGVLQAQHDGLDAAPATLRTGDVVLQRHVLLAPPESAGEIHLGLYRRSSGLRLTHGATPSDLVRLPLPRD